MTAFLTIPDIPGESQRAHHEGEIAVHGLSWAVEQSGSSRVGRGRRRSRADVSPLQVLKLVDKASPYLALAAMQGKAFDEIVLKVHRGSGEGHLDYYTITMENCVLVAVAQENIGFEDPLDSIEESVSIECENIKLTYVEQSDDGSAGDEHEIEYDIVAGV
jgi:type VI secretion system secreted protein Hcp